MQLPVGGYRDFRPAGIVVIVPVKGRWGFFYLGDVLKFPVAVEAHRSVLLFLQIRNVRSSGRQSVYFQYSMILPEGAECLSTTQARTDYKAGDEQADVFLHNECINDPRASKLSSLQNPCFRKHNKESIVPALSFWPKTLLCKVHYPSFVGPHTRLLP
ncbi:MAG: hypothetical protein BWX77_00799 [Bacteroidetes bacterium ADurb.Bin090]|nr:MAG: hypothetical protein BWX77_00799 [Bacteroidetes bacterium ADurb.Bin090]